MMMLWNAMLLALREIKRNVLRSFLTTLGIVIGVAAVITMVTLGGGATAQITEQISSLGSNLLMVTTGRRMGPGQSTTIPSFKQKDVDAIAREISSVRAVAPVSNASSVAIYGSENWSTTITGTDNNYFKVANRPIAEGREFTDSELRSGAMVCLLGETVRKGLFGSQSPLGSKLRLQKLSCTVIGLLEAKGQTGMGRDQDDVILVPIRTFQRRIAPKPGHQPHAGVRGGRRRHRKGSGGHPAAHARTPPPGSHRG